MHLNRTVWLAWAMMEVIMCNAGLAAEQGTPPRDVPRNQVRLTLPGPFSGDDVGGEVARILRAPLDANSSAHVALLNNKSLRARLARVAQGRALARQAGLPANPQLDIESLPERDTQVEFRLGYNISSLFFASLDKAAASAQAEVASMEAAQEAIQLQYQAQLRLYDLVAAQQSVALAQRSLETFAAGREAAHALHKAGNIPFMELGLQVAAHEKSRVLFTQLELAVARKRERFGRLLGLPAGKGWPWTVIDTLPENTDAFFEGSLEDDAVRASFEIQGQKQRLEAANRKRKATAVRGWTPNFMVDVHALYGRPQGSPLRSNQQPWSFGAGVSLNLPLIDRQQGITEVYDVETQALKLSCEAVELEVRSAAREIEAQIRSALTQVEAYRTAILPAQERVTAESLPQYNAMQIGVLPLLQAKREEIAQQLAYVGALKELAQTQAARLALLSGVRPQAVAEPGGVLSSPVFNSTGASDE